MDSSQDKLAQVLQELKRAESWLALSEERVRTLVKVIPAGLLITDLHGKIEAANSEAQEIFNCSGEKLAERNLRELLHAPGEQNDFFEKDTLCEIKEPRELFAGRADGSSIPVELQIREFSSFAERQFLVVVEDITKRVEIQKMKEDFISMITHDLRTPLTSISTFIELISSGVFDDNSSLLKQRSKHMQQEMKRLISMVSGLLDLDKMEAGRLKMIVSPVDCEQLIKRSISSVESLAEQKRIELDFSNKSESGCEVLADADFVLQVLINFLSNALKFSPSGSTIKISLDEADENQIKVSVADQGPGIREEFKTRMFNRYEQAHVSDARLKGGSGLGLAISKKIIEQHGGKIGADSSEGAGSTFWFTIPKNCADNLEGGISSFESELLLPASLNLRRTSLEKIIETALETVENFSEELGLSLEANGTELSVNADYNALLQALVKILTMSLKYAEQGSTIILDTFEGKAGIELSVVFSAQESPEGIEKSENDEISFCRSIIEMHYGTMCVKKDPAGKVSFGLNLPLMEFEYRK